MAYTEAERLRLDQLVGQWLDVDVNSESRREILDLQKNGDYDKLDSKLSKRIAFGTAGLRSSMESGFSHMNDVTIVQASQGLVKYLLKENKKRSSIVVGYDHRFHSQRFAEITASVALSQGLVVYYLGSVDNLSKESLDTSATKPLETVDSEDRLYVHTPMVPFAIDHFEASAGVMVTASHNPAKDNGYKVYYGNGCQIIPPHDDGIAQLISENLKPWLEDEVWDIVKNFRKGLENGSLRSIKEEATQEYVKLVKEKLLVRDEISFPFVYTPMHGIGLEIFEKIVDQFKGTDMTVVPEQIEPDPTFKTVKFPNPEEKGALDLAIATAEKNGIKLVVATDPDADRFSVAIKCDSSWRQLTGNEIGFLFAMYVLEELQPKELFSKTYILNSTVSLQVLASMAQAEGIKFQDTLTGFKWIGNKAIDLKKEGYSVPFGYEEAIGFMFDVVNDKDGISAAAVWLQLYERWFASGELTPVDKLKAGYDKYGWFKEANGYYKLDDLSKTDKIFNTTIRKLYDGSNYPETLGVFKVKEWRDLTIGYESVTANGKPILPVDPKLQMITAVLNPGDSDNEQDQVRFTARGSGTEPKIKIYIEGKSNTEEKAHDLAYLCWKVLKEEWFKPDENGLQEVI
ncbi:hypothetical protein HYPBUDRAFT_7400 [Hyphopichia burtonii NRRL Y-1933]|uniref:Phosphoribomutase n=1 Tax=Hyphopichia burtonii NRRL Y-1933 TaxID=984485 RepID=A0A1E4RFQ0_9ASCO|nr:hypothetical protein HYPBUDRAFT_7400 [Hyphopichia burtonii NRRL Y-1933]ODV66087.1 hypothetical protein HYPBUDRAFT_7400 [Hyphopichia burtonii NRRL Y-1933]